MQLLFDKISDMQSESKTNLEIKDSVAEVFPKFKVKSWNHVTARNQLRKDLKIIGFRQKWAQSVWFILSQTSVLA